jgi:hypothetical protein
MPPVSPYKAWLLLGGGCRETQTVNIQQQIDHESNQSKDGKIEQARNFPPFLLREGGLRLHHSDSYRLLSVSSKRD